MSSYSFQGDKRMWTPRDVEENRAIFSAQRQETGISMPDEFKPIYLENAEHDVEKWSINQIMRLLRLYGAHRILWDIHDEDNRNRKLRRAALVDLAAALGDGITPAQVARKINVLRATYRYERRRIKLRMRKGIGAKTKLKWFALADSFLREVPKIGKLRKRREHTESDSDLEDELVLTIEPDIALSMEKDFRQIEDLTSSKTLDGHQNPSKMVSVDNNELQNQAQSLEEEESSSGNSSDNKPLKPKWTREYSIKFVDALKKYPVLWSKAKIGTEDNQNQALELLAQELRMPISRIRCRVRKFQLTCAQEFAKMRQDLTYKPAYFWWASAESFMLNEEKQHMELENFVDANAAMQHGGSDDENYNEPLATPINPIPSVSVPSVLGCYDGEDCLEHLDTPTLSPPSTQATRLVWNGLTDDLLEGKWSLKHSVKFLRLYGSHRCLWDLNDPDYRSRELRSAAIEDIAAAMGYGLNADYVAKKIKIFRITYMQHRKRILEAIKSGQEPEIQLRWFPLADSFLRPHIGLRSIKEQEREIPQFDYQYVMANLNLIDPELLNDFRGDTIPKSTNEAQNESEKIESRCNAENVSIKTEDDGDL